MIIKIINNCKRVWNLRKKKTLSRRFFDEYSFKQLRRKTRGQWQKCYGEASMSIYYFIINNCKHFSGFMT